MELIIDKELRKVKREQEVQDEKIIEDITYKEKCNYRGITSRGGFEID